MQLFIYVGAILGCVLGGFGICQLYLLRNEAFSEVFVIHCGVHGDFSVWEPDGLPGELLVSDHMMFTMFYITFYYFLYWIVPYRFNQIKKTQKEVSRDFSKEGGGLSKSFYGLWGKRGVVKVWNV
jgi:hypothetical protein